MQAVSRFTKAMMLPPSWKGEFAMTRFLIASMGALACLIPSGAWAEPAAPAFAASPLNDQSLAAVFGGVRPGYAANVRLIVQGDGMALLRQSSEVSRLQMDNWWAQTGAALVGANLIALR